MDWVFPIDPPRPSELWVHAGPAKGLFPSRYFHETLDGGSPPSALQLARRVQRPVLLITRMGHSGLNFARRWGRGVCERNHLPTSEHYDCAAVVTTSFYDGERCILGCIKNRGQSLFSPFDYESGTLTRTLWDHVTET